MGGMGTENESYVFPQDAILVALLEAKTPLSARCLMTRTGFSTTSVRDHLRVMTTSTYYREPWVHQHGGRPATWSLTPKGKEVARWRRKSERQAHTAQDGTPRQ